MSFWETLPGIIASWAAAIAGLGYLVKVAWRGWKRTRKISIAVGRLLEIGDAESWPNGSKTLPQTIRTVYSRQEEIYKRQAETYDLVHATKNRVEDYIVAHRADHGLLPPEHYNDAEGTPNGF